jgi:hypothetical protein
MSLPEGKSSTYAVQLSLEDYQVFNVSTVYDERWLLVDPPYVIFTSNTNLAQLFVVTAVDNWAVEGDFSSVVTHHIVNLPTQYVVTDVLCDLEVQVSDNDVAGVSIHKNLTAMNGPHKVDISSNDVSNIYVNGDLVIIDENTWPSRATHTFMAPCDEPTVLGIYAADTTDGLGGLAAIFDFCDEENEVDQRTWNCQPVTNIASVEPAWHSTLFDVSNWPWAVEHDLGCFNGPFYRYEGTLDETVDGTPCVDWGGREGFDISARNYCRLPYGNPYGDTATWCYTNETAYGYCSIPRCDVGLAPGTLCDATGNRLEVRSAASYITWEAAQLLAADAGGHLVTVATAAEQACVSSSTFAPAWIGVNQTLKAMEDSSDRAIGWMWVTEEPFEYSDWHSTDPPDTVEGGAAVNVMGPKWHVCIDGAPECGSVSSYIVEYERIFKDLDWIWTSDTTDDDAMYCRHVREVPSIGPTTQEDVLPLRLTEGGHDVSYIVRLTSEPTHNVTVNVIADKQIEGIAGCKVATTPDLCSQFGLGWELCDSACVPPTTNSITITPATWDEGRLVTVRAVQDKIFDKLHLGIISHEVVSDDRDYSVLEIAGVRAQITDDGEYVAGLEVAPATVFGCTDEDAFDYNSNATASSSCIAVAYGCTDHAAINYNSTANTDDGNCTAAIQGCVDARAYNHNSAANRNDEGLSRCIYDPCLDLGGAHNCSASASCEYFGDNLVNCTCLPGFVGNGSWCDPIVTGCMAPGAFNYDYRANVHLNSSCIPKLYGCVNYTNVSRPEGDAYYMINVDNNANTDNGNCIPKIFGCMNETNLNFDPTANMDEGKCQDPYVAELRMWTGQFAEEVSWFIVDPFGTFVIGESSPGYRNNENYTYSMPIASGVYTFVAQAIGYGWSGTLVTVAQSDSTVVFEEMPTDEWDFITTFDFTVPCSHHEHCEKFHPANYCNIDGMCGTCTDCFNNLDSHDGLGWAGCPLECWAVTSWGCTDKSAFNHDPTANANDLNCTARSYGCIDMDAANYNETANTDDGSCIAVVSYTLFVEHNFIFLAPIFLARCR